MKYRPTRPLRLLRFLARSIDKNGYRGAIVDFYEHLFRSLRSRGVTGTLKNTFRDAPSSPEDGAPKQPHPFDLLHGTDTGGYIPGRSISAISLSALYTTAYTGISPSAMTQALATLPIQCEDFTFVDLGCGKGRALMVAAQFPFRHLLGVEIAGELCDVAQDNVTTNPDWADRISIVNRDATKVTFPQGPLLVYLFNPFLAHVLQRVLKNLERQLRRSPRPAYILYADNPRFKQVMESFTYLKELSHTAYPISPEDAAFDYSQRTQEYFTLYCADFTSLAKTIRSDQGAASIFRM